MAQAEKPTKAYVAGPMRGYDQFNFPMFDKCALYLREELGWKVCSPAEHDRETGFDETRNGLTDFDFQAAMQWDLAAVLWADCVVLLPDWRESTGVGIELNAARATGKTLWEWHPMGVHLRPLHAETPLQEADRIVAGPRQADYGHPAEDFARTGRMWGAILGIPDVPPALVGLCMAALKISREVNLPKRDNLVDIAGYVKTVHLVRERENAQ